MTRRRGSANAARGLSRLLLSAVISAGGYLSVLRLGVAADLDAELQWPGFPVAAAVAILLLGFVLLVTFSLPGRFADVAAPVVVLALFALPLAAIWQSGRSDGSHLGGLLPFSDASGYYHCARVLVAGDGLSASPAVDFCSRRPLFTSALAGVLLVTGHDLRQALALLVLLTAVSSLLAARELRASEGAVAGTLFLITVFVFYRRFVGTTLTEHLGVALGTGGFAALWHGARTAHAGTAHLGLFLLTLALNARAGAFLALPAIALWAARTAPGAASFSWRSLGLAGGVMALGFALNALLLVAIGGAPTGLFSNFSYPLYGLVFGGDWTSALRDHPALGLLAESEQARWILALVVDGVRADPWRLVRGALRAWGAFLGTPFPFAYVGTGSLNLMLRLLAVLGLFRALRRRGEPTMSLLLCATIGLLASVPFAPPWDADRMRVYAATIPFLAALPALGAAWLLGRVPIRWLAATLSGDTGVSRRPLIALAGLLVALPFLSPIGTTLLGTRPRFPGAAGPDCGDAIYVRAPIDSLVRVVEDAAARRYPFELRQSEFRWGLRQLQRSYPDLARELANLSAPFILFNALGLDPFRFAYIVAGTRLVPESPSRAGFWRVCVESPGSVAARTYGLFRATAIAPASPRARIRRAARRSAGCRDS